MGLKEKQRAEQQKKKKRQREKWRRENEQDTQLEGRKEGEIASSESPFSYSIESLSESRLADSDPNQVTVAPKEGQRRRILTHPR